jgi:hypothetical protein
MCLREIGSEDVDWICLGQERDQWWAVVNMVIFVFHRKQEFLD